MYLYKYTLITWFLQHSAKINYLSVDEEGEFLASCSDDGKVYTFKFMHVLYFG